MPNSQRCARRATIIVTTLLLLVVAAIACSSESDAAESAPTTVPPTATEIPREVIGDFESCKGFLDAQIIEDLTGGSGLFERERVIRAVPGSTESGAVSNCLVEVFRSVERNDVPTPGKSLSLSIVNFSSKQFAIDVFDSTLASVLLSVEQIGDAAEVQQEVIGTDSYLLDINVGGIGAIVVYVSDTVFISMSSTSDSDGNALLTSAQLVTAAEGVQARLPQFANTRFTDQ